MEETLCVAVDSKRPGPSRDYFFCFKDGLPHRSKFLIEVFSGEQLSRIYSLSDPNRFAQLNGLELYNLLGIRLDFYTSYQEKRELRKDYRITSDGMVVRL